MIFKWKRAAWTKTKTLKWQKEGIELQLENKRVETRHLVGPELLKIGNFWKVGKRSNSGYSTESSLLCLPWGGLHEAGAKCVPCRVLSCWGDVPQKAESFQQLCCP